MSKTGFVVAAIVLAASPACAHVGLETKQATIGASYKAVFTVPPVSYTHLTLPTICSV